MSPTLLQQIKEANKRYLTGSPQLLDSTGDPFVVLACMDPRLTGVLSIPVCGWSALDEFASIPDSKFLFRGGLTALRACQ